MKWLVAEGDVVTVSRNPFSILIRFKPIYRYGSRHVQIEHLAISTDDSITHSLKDLFFYYTRTPSSMV